MYETPIKLARDNFAQLMHVFIQAIQKAAKEPYASMSEADATQRLSPVLDNYLSYLETGDITKWREFCTYIISTRVKQGLDYTVIIDIDEIMLERLTDFYTRVLLPFGTVDGEPAAKVLERLKNRFNGLHTVAKLTATAAAMQSRHNPI